MRLRMIWLFLVLGLLASNAWAVGHLGPPTAQLNQGQWSIGFNYSHSDQDLETIKAQFSGVEYDGIPEILIPYMERIKTRNFKSNRYYGRLAYGLTDWWEVYGQLGAADLKGDVQYEDNEEWFSSDLGSDFAWGWGTKLTFAKQDSVAWGVTVQMNWLDNSMSENYAYTDPNDLGEFSLDIDGWDLVVAVGPTIDMGSWKLYGGPFYYMLDADYDEKYVGSYDDGVEAYNYIYRSSGDLEEGSNFGGYIGETFELADNWDVTIECSATGDGWGVGGGIAVKF